jgi:DNA-binding transcriptional ArsR family regulator
MSEALANTAKLFAEPARAAMLLILMGGRAVPAGELAVVAHVSPQTASEHLARLIEGGCVTAQRQGRHRYYELANADVAHVVESLLVLSSAPCAAIVSNTLRPAFGTLEHARTCYGHLAGWLSVAIADALQRKGYLAAMPERAFLVTDDRKEWFEKLGIPAASSSTVTGIKFLGFPHSVIFTVDMVKITCCNQYNFGSTLDSCSFICRSKSVRPVFLISSAI